MICNKTLVLNQRYLFLIETPHKMCHFRANFLDCINYTLRVTKYQDESSINNLPSEGIHCMPKGWIAKVESLDESSSDDILLSFHE